MKQIRKYLLHKQDLTLINYSTVDVLDQRFLCYDFLVLNMDKEDVTNLESILSTLPEGTIRASVSLTYARPKEDVLSQIGLTKYTGKIVTNGLTKKVDLDLNKKEVLELCQKQVENVEEYDKSPLTVPNVMVQDLNLRGEGYEIKIYPVFSEAYVKLWGVTMPQFIKAFQKELMEKEYSMRLEWGNLQHPDHT